MTHEPFEATAPGAENAGGSDLCAQELSDFLRQYCAALLAVGSPTRRVDRSAARIAAAFGFAVDVALLPRHLMLTVSARDGKDHCTSVGSIHAGAPDFKKIAALNALGWHLADGKLDLGQACARMDSILREPAADPRVVRLLAACANAAFCRLFGGDAIAMALVFTGTLTAFFLRQCLHKWGIDPKVSFVLCAFVASLLAAPAVFFHWGSTPHTALAASVLFLIPGIPLINATLDFLDGRTLMGMARAVAASIHIICIALGLALTMALLGVSRV